MADDLQDYLAFARANPALFVNPPEGGFIIVLDEAEIREIEAYMAAKLKAKGMPEDWARVGIAFQDQYALLLRDAVRFPDGTPGTYIRFVGSEFAPPGVVVLPIYQDQVLIVRHFRHATRTWHLELPRGFGKPGLSSEQCAREELSEEIQGTATRLIALGTVYPDAGADAGHVDLFYADVASYGTPDANEGIVELLSVTVRDFERMIRENVITDGFTLAAYARAKLQGLL